MKVDLAKIRRRKNAHTHATMVLVFAQYLQEHKNARHALNTPEG